MSDEVLYEVRGATALVTMNRPERLNALDSALVDALRNLFNDLYWRRDIRVVVLAGAMVEIGDGNIIEITARRAEGRE